MIKLQINRKSASCQPPWILLHLSGIEQSIVDIDSLNGETRTEEFKKINPLQTVPVLQHDDFYVFESNAIMRQLCDNFEKAKHFYHFEPKIKAKIDISLDQKQNNLYPCVIKTIFDKYGFNTLFNLQYTDEERNNAKSALLSIHFPFILNYLLNENFFISGETPCIGDFALVSGMKYMQCLKFWKEEVPIQIKNYCRRIEELGWNDLTKDYFDKFIQEYDENN